MTREQSIIRQISRENGYPVELVEDMLYAVYTLEAYSKDNNELIKDELTRRYKENLLHIQKKHNCTVNCLIVIKQLIDNNEDYQKFFGHLSDEV